MNVTAKEKPSGTNELHDWIDAEVPHMIDEEMQSLQADHDEVTVDEESLKQTKKEIGDIIKSLFQ